MKISWGTGITITIIIFMLISFWFIYFAFSQEVNLVRDDYYQAELNFDNKLEATERADSLNNKVELEIINKNLSISFPDFFNKNLITGSILLYRPSDQGSDFREQIKLDSSNTQLISIETLKNGMWRAQIDWQVDSLEYFTEQIFMVNN